MDDKTNRLVVDFARPLQVGEATEDGKDKYPLELKMEELIDPADTSKGKTSPPYEILMNYGVWPSGDSEDADFVLGDDGTAPWTITMPVVGGSSVTQAQPPV